jgi:hypothetical protein
LTPHVDVGLMMIASSGRSSARAWQPAGGGVVTSDGVGRVGTRRLLVGLGRGLRFTGAPRLIGVVVAIVGAGAGLRMRTST